MRIDRDKIYDPWKMKKPKMIFVNSMSDLFHERVPIKILVEAFNVMCGFGLICKKKDCEHDNPECYLGESINNHTYQILTKRPQRMLQAIKHDIWEYSGNYMSGDEPLCLQDGKLPNNIWLGVSVENQQTVDERTPLLLQTPAAVRWLSVEPMLEGIRLWNWIAQAEGSRNINWVVVGAESGHQRRECKIEWVEGTVDQCKQANVPVFVKQLQINGKIVKDIDQFPKHLQIREYPR